MFDVALPLNTQITESMELPDAGTELFIKCIWPPSHVVVVLNAAMGLSFTSIFLTTGVPGQLSGEYAISVTW